MTTLTLPTTPGRAKIAAALALPLGVMTTIGSIIFFELSWLMPISLWALANAIATLAGATQTLAGRPRGVELLRLAAISEIAFTAVKLAVWQEIPAIPFGVVSLAILSLLRPPR